VQAVIDAFFFEADELDRIAMQHRDEYASAPPGERLGAAWKQWIPPAAADAARRLRRRG
jgi:hypothetical protein